MPTLNVISSSSTEPSSDYSVIRYVASPVDKWFDCMNTNDYNRPPSWATLKSERTASTTKAATYSIAYAKTSTADIKVMERILNGDIPNLTFNDAFTTLTYSGNKDNRPVNKKTALAAEVNHIHHHKVLNGLLPAVERISRRGKSIDDDLKDKINAIIDVLDTMKTKQNAVIARVNAIQADTYTDIADLSYTLADADISSDQAIVTTNINKLDDLGEYIRYLHFRRRLVIVLHHAVGKGNWKGRWVKKIADEVEALFFSDDIVTDGLQATKIMMNDNETTAQFWTRLNTAIGKIKALGNATTTYLPDTKTNTQALTAVKTAISGDYKV